MKSVLNKNLIYNSILKKFPQRFFSYFFNNIISIYVHVKTFSFYKNHHSIVQHKDYAYFYKNPWNFFNPLPIIPNNNPPILSSQ